MKLISLNVALFEKNNKNLQRFFKDQKADILCLQEVARRIDKSVEEDWISKEAIDESTTNLTHSFFAPLSVVSNFQTRKFHGYELFQINLGGKVEYGNYIKTRYPIIKGQNIFLQNHFTYRTDWTKWPEEDYRAIQVVDLKLENTKLRLLNYHGIWSKEKKDSLLTKKACHAIYKLAIDVNYPVIICGDFNLFPDTESIRLFSPKFTNLINTHNIKTTRPKKFKFNQAKRNVVDYILISKSIKLNKFEVIDTDISDHLPLVINFEI